MMRLSILFVVTDVVASKCIAEHFPVFLIQVWLTLSVPWTAVTWGSSRMSSPFDLLFTLSNMLIWRRLRRLWGQWQINILINTGGKGLHWRKGKKPNAANSQKGKLCNYFKSVFDIFSGSSFLISTSSFAVTKSFLKIDTWTGERLCCMRKHIHRSRTPYSDMLRHNIIK